MPPSSCKPRRWWWRGTARSAMCRGRPRGPRRWCCRRAAFHAGRCAVPTQPSKRRVAVLGAGGLVGQRLVRLLLDHPFFELVTVGGSPRRAGTPFGETLRPLTADDLRPDTIPPALAALVVQPCEPGAAYDCDLVFS